MIRQPKVIPKRVSISPTLTVNDSLPIRTLYLTTPPSADTTNGRPAIKVTGTASTNVSWVANVKMTKVGY